MLLTEKVDEEGLEISATFVANADFVARRTNFVTSKEVTSRKEIGTTSLTIVPDSAALPMGTVPEVHRISGTYIAS